MNNEFAPRKAEKKRVKLKMAVQGPSGSGKTWGALALAKNLWPQAKICVIDTENESASLYADKFTFDTIPLGPPFTTARYVECIDASVKAGYDVLIIDTITAQWDGSGGILQRKNEMDMRGGNSFTNWSSFTPEHEAFKQIMLQAPIHVIATMRSKQDYILQANDKGKQMPKKVGMAPIQRDQIDYEFTIVFDVQMDHKAVSSKDRTGLFNDKVVDLADPMTADAIRGWLESGVEVAQKPASASATPAPAQSPPQRPAASPEPSQEQKRDPQQYPYAILAGTTLTCTPLTITEKTRTVPKTEENPEGTQPYIFVYFKGNVNSIDFPPTSEFSCFDTGLFEAIRAGLKQECQFKVEVKEKAGKMYINVKDAMWIDNAKYVEGKPVNMDAEPA
jgi:GTPase SAR1 family protein